MQDDFKLRRNLTLNLGLRWSYFGPLLSKQGNMYWAIPGAGADFLTGLVVRKGDSWNPEKNNFGPQVGFAWSPSRFNDKLVIRGGYGLSYNQEEIAISANITGNPGWWCTRHSTCPRPARRIPALFMPLRRICTHSSDIPSNPNAIVSFWPEWTAHNRPGECQHLPRHPSHHAVHHYSLDTQYDLGHQFVATLGYRAV